MGGQYSWTSGLLLIWRAWGKIQPVVNWTWILNNIWNSFSITVLMEFLFAKLMNEITEIILEERQLGWQVTDLLSSCTFTSWGKKFNSVLLFAFIGTQDTTKELFTDGGGGNYGRSWVHCSTYSHITCQIIHTTSPCLLCPVPVIPKLHSIYNSKPEVEVHEVKIGRPWTEICEWGEF